MQGNSFFRNCSFLAVALGERLRVAAMTATVATRTDRI